MQPTYLPWLGYFDLMDQADVFVFLDNVQFARRSWQQRNRIRGPKGLQWLSVPVKKRGRYHRDIRSTKIVKDGRFPTKHLRALEYSYKGAPHFKDYFPGIRDILMFYSESLADTNTRLVFNLVDALGIEFGEGEKWKLASELEPEGKRSDLLADICRKVGADTYLSPTGAMIYLIHEREPFEKAGVSVRIHQYVHPTYRQQWEPFLPHASTVDLLFNEGPRSLEIIRSGRRKSEVL